METNKYNIIQIETRYGVLYLQNNLERKQANKLNKEVVQCRKTTMHDE